MRAVREVMRKALAKAWEAGFEAAAEAAGDCCGCNAYNSERYKNPYAEEDSSSGT